MSKYLPLSVSLPEYDILVFCHLRWDLAFDRPQQLMSRLAQEFKILFVEEPGDIYSSDKSYIRIQEIGQNLHVCTPLVKDLAEVGVYLKKHLPKKTYRAGWFYSPAFVAVLKELDFDVVLYDCTEELSLSKDVTSGMLSQEKALLSVADIVFTGSKSLYEQKSREHRNVSFFPNSVDVTQFSKRKNKKKPVDLQPIKKRIIGYCGVIDERFDLQLVKEVSANNPGVAFVMVGPLHHIERRHLPKADNIHYLGPKPHEELLHYLTFFDVAMLPLLVNETTRYSNPLAILEYMAANKPIISTAVPEIVRDYSGCTNIVSSPAEFSTAIENPKSNFAKAYLKILKNTSWDETVRQMSRIINKVEA